MSDDELISGYVDGQLSAAERAAFEIRLTGNAVLRRRVATTRLLAAEARRMPTMAAPRNFILPHDSGQTKPTPAPSRSQSLLPVWLLRLGSIASALLFVFVVALDVTRPTAFSPASAPAAPPPTVAKLAGTIVAAAPSAFPAVAEGATTNVQPMAATVALATLPTTPLAQARALPGASAMSSTANEIGAGDVAQSPQSPEALLITATPGPLMESATESLPTSITQVQAQATPAPLVAEYVTPQTEPLITPLRVLAASALALAIALGILGWLRR